jgi:hypothetical protein
MIKFEKIKPGMVLYDVHTYQMGNTTLRSHGEWEVQIIEVYPETRSASVSWNGNRPEVWQEKQLTKLRAKKTEMVRMFGFGQRPAKKHEKKGAKAP